MTMMGEGTAGGVGLVAMEGKAVEAEEAGGEEVAMGAEGLSREGQEDTAGAGVEGTRGEGVEGEEGMGGRGAGRVGTTGPVGVDREEAIPPRRRDQERPRGERSHCLTRSRPTSGTEPRNAREKTSSGAHVLAAEGSGDTRHTSISPCHLAVRLTACASDSRCIALCMMLLLGREWAVPCPPSCSPRPPHLRLPCTCARSTRSCRRLTSHAVHCAHPAAAQRTWAYSLTASISLSQ